MLINVTLPSLETTKKALLGSYNLKYINADKLENIDDMAFENCSLLESVSFANAKYVGTRAFKSCFLLVSVSLPNASFIGDRAFEDCHLLKSIYLPNVTNLNSSVFSGCSSLANLTLESVRKIVPSESNDTFRLLISLKEIHLPSIRSLCDNDFFTYCPVLERIYLPCDMPGDFPNNIGFEKLFEVSVYLPSKDCLENNWWMELINKDGVEYWHNARLNYLDDSPNVTISCQSCRPKIN